MNIKTEATGMVRIIKIKKYFVKMLLCLNMTKGDNPVKVGTSIIPVEICFKLVNKVKNI